MSDIQTLLKQASHQLASVSDSPQLDAELLLAHCLDKTRSYLFTWNDKAVDETTQQQFTALIEKRLTDYPVAYLLGQQGFWSLDLLVTPDTLIPRPETELLVETALEKVKSIKSPKILDLGTGTGAIALALASERPDATIIATDYSSKALEVAKKNATKNELSNLRFLQSNWFEAIDEIGFDLIVSNPPYIKSADPHLQQGIRHEPLQALASGITGLDDIHTILQQAPDFLKSGCWIILEHGYDQGKDVPALIEQYGFSKAHCVKDYANNDRISLGIKL